MMSDVMQTFEGSTTLVECVNDPNVCQRFEACVTREVWDEMATAMNKVLESTTLADLVERYQQKDTENKDMYYI